MLYIIYIMKYLVTYITVHNIISYLINKTNYNIIEFSFIIDESHNYLIYILKLYNLSCIYF